MVETRIFRHGRLSVEFDLSEWFPDDPGAGTPAVVRVGGHSSSLWWAMGEGVVGDFDDVVLTIEELRWLEEVVEPEVDRLLAQKG